MRCVNVWQSDFSVKKIDWIEILNIINDNEVLQCVDLKISHIKCLSWIGE